MRVSVPLLAVSAVFASGCDILTMFLERQAITKAEFAFNRAEFSRIDIPFITPDARVEFKVVLDVKNPNSMAAVLDKFDYEARLQEQAVGSGSLPEDFRVEAGGKKEMVLPVAVRYESLARPVLDALQGAIQAKEIAVGVKGTSHLTTPVGTLDFPMQVGGRQKIDTLLQLPLFSF